MSLFVAGHVGTDVLGLGHAGVFAVKVDLPAVEGAGEAVLRAHVVAHELAAAVRAHIVMRMKPAIVAANHDAGLRPDVELHPVDSLAHVAGRPAQKPRLRSDERRGGKGVSVRADLDGHSLIKITST